MYLLHTYARNNVTAAVDSEPDTIAACASAQLNGPLRTPRPAALPPARMVHIVEFQLALRKPLWYYTLAHQTLPRAKSDAAGRISQYRLALARPCTFGR
jgi:hypothetical protein